LTAQRNPTLYHVYIDAFAGAGVHISKSTGNYIPGSPVNALLVTLQFREYHLVDIDRQKVALLRDLVKNNKNVRIHEGDCNHILLEKIFSNARWDQYRRGLCLLLKSGDARISAIFCSLPLAGAAETAVA
jgi:three-Cys-motif partner protein